MLKEYFVSERAGEPKRRWFGDEFFELILWLDSDGTIRGFQLVYNRLQAKRALTWKRDAGYSHDRVDDGESTPTADLTPILIGNEEFHRDEVLPCLVDAATDLDPSIRDFVVAKVRSYYDDA